MLDAHPPFLAKENRNRHTMDSELLLGEIHLRVGRSDLGDLQASTGSIQHVERAIRLISHVACGPINGKDSRVPLRHAEREPVVHKGGGGEQAPTD